ncbi:MAG: hypothetical protein U9Q74_08765, partial [Gemmatimonadota bacterium]|nr:hypothetical protein [Gemmatimonadota bacterium]
MRAIVGQPAPELSVELVDGTGATLAAAAADVRVRLVGGSSQLSGQIQRPLDAGKATFNDLRVGTPGVYRLEASVATSGRTITAVTPEFPVSPRPVLLDSASTNAIGDSLGTQVVISGAGASQAFDSGTVIVGTSGQGFIREVLGRAAAGGAVVLRTRPATLNQVIQNGGFTTTMALRGPAGGGDGRGASGNDVAAVTMPFDATFSFGKVSIDDPMSGSSVSVTAGVTFSGSATLDAQFAGFRTKHFLFAVDGQLALTADYAATIRAGLAAQKTFRPDAPLFRVSRLVPVNGWPVLVTSTGRVSFTASAHGGQAINVQGTPQVGRSFHLASEYAGDGWTNTQSSQPLANAPPSSVAPTGAVVLDLGLGLEAKVVVDVALYDLAGVYAFALAHGDVNLTADMPAYMARLMCEASAGVGAGIGFTEDVKDFIADHHLPFGIELPALEFSAPIPGKQFCNESFEFTPTREVRISNLPSVITLGGSVVAAAQPYVVWGGQPVP